MPVPHQLIFPNSTSVLLKLNAWPDNGCPILYFVLQYRALTDEGEDPLTLVSNALKPQRRFSVSGLKPSTFYQLKMEAHNVAGSTTADFTFVTLTKDGGLCCSSCLKCLLIKRISLRQQIRLRPTSGRLEVEQSFSTTTLKLSSLPSSR
jgi:hypothetical protein